MTNSQRLWLRAARLLSYPRLFDSERERVLERYSVLNSHGLGQVCSRHGVFWAHGGHSGLSETECILEDLDAARDELRAGGRYETGIRNTLEYLARRGCLSAID